MEPELQKAFPKLLPLYRADEVFPQLPNTRRKNPLPPKLHSPGEEKCFPPVLPPHVLRPLLQVLNTRHIGKTCVPSLHRNQNFSLSLHVFDCVRHDFLHHWQCMKNIYLDMSHDTGKIVKPCATPS